MTTVNFPYKDTPEGLFPVILVRLFSQTAVTETPALIDSGATVSLFKADIAEKLGIEVKRGSKIVLGGISGRILGYRHKVPVELAGKQFICPMVFSYEYTASFNLLGREIFFKLFTITFAEQQRLVKLESN